MKAKKSTGHTKGLREQLRDERKHRKLSTEAVAELIVKRLAEQVAEQVAAGEPVDADPTLSGESLRLYEKMERNPKINVFAAWAHVLGMKLVVELDRAELGRTNVMIKTPEAIEIAKMVDAMPSGRRKALLRYLQEQEATDAEE